MIRSSTLVLLFTLGCEGCVQLPDATQVGIDQTPRVVTVSGATAAQTDDATTVPGLVDLPRYPAISPDAAWITFTWRGDLWKVSSGGGHAERITRHPKNDVRSAWSRDGTRIAFISDRAGGANVFIMNADGTHPRQVTDTDQWVLLTGFGVDEEGQEVVTLYSRREGDTYQASRPYMCSTSGGDILRLHDAFGSFPQISPDGRLVAFTRGESRWTRRHYRGPDARDVWVYNRGDHTFRRLTDWEGNDGLARWAGDDALVFLSDRELDCFNVYRMDVSKGDKSAKRLTSFAEDDVQYVDVSADGSTAVLMVWDTLYTLDLESPGADPVALTITANEDEKDNFELKAMRGEVDEAMLSPDGKVMAYAAYGEIYVRNIEEGSATRRVTHSHANDRDIVWSPDGLKLYFVSDRDGTDSIYAASVTLTRGEVKEEFDKLINPPKEEDEDEGDKAKESGEETDAAAGAPVAEAESEPATTAGEGEDGADTGNAANAAEPESNGKADEDADKKGKDKEEEKLPKELQPDRWHDAMKFAITPVMQTEHNDRNPSPSLDGKSLAFRRGLGDLMIQDVETGEVRTLVTGWDTGLHWAWSPDSRHIAYAHADLDYNEDIFIIPVDACKPAVNITRHSDSDINPQWSADGKILSFVSERVDEEFDVYSVYLDKDLEALTPQELEQYYKDAVEAAKKRTPLKIEKPKDEGPDDDTKGEDKPKVESKEDDGEPASAESKGDTEGEDEKADVDGDDGKDDEEDKKEEEEPKELDLDDAYLRVRRITTFPGNEYSNALTPGGDRYIFNADIDGRALFSVKWDGSERKRVCGPHSLEHVSLTGDKVVVVDGGRAAMVAPTGGELEYVDINDTIRIDLQEQASQKFLELARRIGEEFYHPQMKGLDWVAITKKYHALARQTRTAGEFDHVGMRLFGELNGSHLGVFTSEPPAPNAQANGKLGITHKRVDDGYEVLSILSESPAAKGPMALAVGDVITAIELEPFGPSDTVESRLAGRVGKETIISVKRTLEDGEIKELNVLLTPIGRRELGDLRYKAWRLEAARLVDEWSDGKLGYIHIEGMGQASLDIFERDLYAAAAGKDGLLVDVRNNGGGWTADRLLASIMVQPHAYTIPRGADPNDVGHYPQPRLFIQRYTLPIDMLCNEKSFSNAEIVAHAFKTLKRGTLVGMQTYGGVISTGGMALIDGTFVRLPGRGWFLVDGTDMENAGAMPDVVVPQTPEAESRGDDEQLRAAVDELLKRIQRDPGPRFGPPKYSR